MDPITEIKASLKAIKDRADEVDQVQEHVEAIGRRVNDLDKEVQGLARKQLTARQGGGDGTQLETAEQREHTDLFLRWMRNPRSHAIRSELESLEQKQASGTSDSAGGVLVPELLGNRIIERVKQISPMRRLVNVQTIGSSDFKAIRSDSGASSGWVGELATRNATDTPAFTEIALAGGTVYALVSASEEIVQDSQYDLQNHLLTQISRELAKAEGIAIISGNGTNKPKGLLNVTPESTEDGASPPRTEGALKYLPTGVSGGFAALVTGSPYTNPADILIDTVYDLKSEHRAGASWVMNSATAATVRKFKDGDGRYLWSDPIAAGQPPLLLGYQVMIAEDWPDEGANAHPIAFGNFSNAYMLGDRAGLRITLDDNITTPGVIRWYARRRVYGAVVDDEAVRVIKQAAS